MPRTSLETSSTSSYPGMPDRISPTREFGDIESVPSYLRAYFTPQRRYPHNKRGFCAIIPNLSTTIPTTRAGCSPSKSTIRRTRSAHEPRRISAIYPGTVNCSQGLANKLYKGAGSSLPLVCFVTGKAPKGRIRSWVIARENRYGPYSNTPRPTCCHFH